ncbi:hypothetical protein BYT27DRAFT_6448137 [Phlegmacium glaucopus]|nr:hypothetical protein BYT27DRAFT_6448137 [Phlegmacium glaucopus]
MWRLEFSIAPENGYDSRLPYLTISSRDESTNLYKFSYYNPRGDITISRSQPHYSALHIVLHNGISSELFDVTTVSLQTLFRKRTTELRTDLGVPVLLSVARFARRGFWCCTRDADKIQNGGLATERGSGAMKGQSRLRRKPTQGFELPWESDSEVTSNSL